MSEESETEKPLTKRVPDLDEDDTMKRVQLMIPDKWYKKMGEIALQKETSRGAVMREALRDYFAKIEKPIEPNPEAKVSDKDLNEILDACSTFFGGFMIDEEEEGFIAVMEENEIKLSDLTPDQFERVCDKLIIGYKGYWDRPEIDEFIEKFPDMTEKQKKTLREKLEALEEGSEEGEEW